MGGIRTRMPRCSRRGRSLWRGYRSIVRCDIRGRGTEHRSRASCWPERLGLDLPVCGEVWWVIAGEISAREAYRGLEVEAGHENEPG
jgi:hypothetical protein